MLSRDKAEELGLKFSIEGETRPEAPDQEIWAADLTIDGHTERFAGKSEEDILEQAQRVLVSRGRLSKGQDDAGGGEPTVAQETDEADLAAFQAQRDETPEEIEKQLEQRGLDSDTEIVQEPGQEPHEADDAA